MREKDWLPDPALEAMLSLIATRSGASAALLAFTDGALVAYAGALARTPAEH